MNNSGFSRCEKCGKVFRQKTRGQKYCYDPCFPKELKVAGDKEQIKTDCIMFHEEDGKTYCSGLNAVYCAYEDCKFYKRRKSNE